jgi:hypothetical protein
MKSENKRAEQDLPRSRGLGVGVLGKVAQTMHRHIIKYKNDKNRKKK